MSIREPLRTALERIFERLGMRPLRSGDMYYFGMTGSGRTSSPVAKALESQNVQTAAAQNSIVQTSQLLGRANVILEVDAFRPLWHVTLRWNPTDSGLRQEVECGELERELAETPAPEHALGFWLTLGAFALFLSTCVLGIVWMIHSIVTR